MALYTWNRFSPPGLTLNEGYDHAYQAYKQSEFIHCHCRVDFVGNDGESNQLGQNARQLLNPKSIPNWLRFLLLTLPVLRSVNLKNLSQTHRILLLDLSSQILYHSSTGTRSNDNNNAFQKPNRRYCRKCSFPQASLKSVIFWLAYTVKAVQNHETIKIGTALSGSGKTRSCFSTGALLFKQYLWTHLTLFMTNNLLSLRLHLWAWLNRFQMFCFSLVIILSKFGQISFQELLCLCRPAAEWFIKRFTTEKSQIVAFIEANGYLLGASKVLLTTVQS